MKKELGSKIKEKKWIWVGKSEVKEEKVRLKRRKWFLKKCEIGRKMLEENWLFVV